MTAEIIDGKKIAENIRKNIKKDIEIFNQKYDLKPRIATVIIGENKESNLYLTLRDKACKKVGIESVHFSFPSNVTEKEVLEKIYKLNKDKKIHGVLIQMPIPEHISKTKLFETLSPNKDVEGFTPENMGRLILGEEFIVPCTPLAVLKIIEHENIDLESKDVVIVNHSTVVGRPLSELFLNRNASVSVAHVFTKDLFSYTNKADILVSAAGVPGIIKKAHVKPECFVIDVGIVKTDNGITGDVDFDEVKDIAAKLTPVPGGVGPVTVACSLLNMIKTFKRNIQK